MSVMTIEAPPTEGVVRVLLLGAGMRESQHVESALSDPCHGHFSVTWKQSIADTADSNIADLFDVVLIILPDDQPRAAAAAPLEQAATKVPVVFLGNPEADSDPDRAGGEFLQLEKIEDGSLARTIRYVVERQRLAHELREAQRTRAEKESYFKGQLQNAMSARDASNRLIDALAHESRTPLTVVQEYCSLVRDGLAGPVTDEQRQYLGIAMSRVADLGCLLNDFVDASWLDSGTHRLRPKPVRLVEVVDRLEAALLPKATAGHVRIEFRVSRDMPDVYCDPELIGRVIASLAGHAIRSACEEGVVRIWAEAMPDQRQVIVAVANLPTGAGAENRGLIPPPSGIVSEGDAGQVAPTCFSIAMAKTLVRASLSELRMQRNGDQAAAYYFALPEADPEAVTACYIRNRNRGDGGLAAVAIILVSLDEDAGNTASDGLDELLFNTIVGSDLVFRLEACQWILVVDATSQEPQAIADRVREAWLQSYCGRAKQPPEILLQVKATYHIPTKADETTMATDEHAFSLTPREPSKPCILLVDDDRSIVDALRIRLSLSGYEVLTAHDGMQGLFLASERRPSLILLDIRMPVMDGLTMLTRMRDSETTRHIPVVILSASHDDRQRALELGAYFFLEKPYDPNVLKIMIASILRSPVSRQARVAPPAVAARPGVRESRSPA
ncbi:MAG TPA: hybrid sensor histidine kinase/response regulator [Pirellulales bacterium]|jgi:CheY-like chemotaxis protein/signal transduction histidine kinase|nr:hybrid sensor histidine kinase/response regulator [Pirellulales bacterium]